MPQYRVTVLGAVTVFDEADVKRTDRGAWFQIAGHESRAWLPDTMFEVVLNGFETVAHRAGQINARIDDGTVTDNDLAELSGLALQLREMMRGATQ